MKSTFIFLISLLFCLSNIAQVNEQPKDVVYRYYDSVTKKNKLHQNFIESYEQYAEGISDIKHFDSVSNLYKELACKDSSNYFAWSRYYLSKVVYFINRRMIGEAEYYNDLYYDLAKKMNNKYDENVGLRRIIGLASLYNDTATMNKYIPIIHADLENFGTLVHSEKFNYLNLGNYFYFINYLTSYYNTNKDSANIRKIYQYVQQIQQDLDSSTYIRDKEKQFFQRTVLLVSLYYKAYFPNEIKQDFYETINQYFLDSNANKFKYENYDASRLYAYVAMQLNDPVMMKKALSLVDKFNLDISLINNESLKLHYDAASAYMNGNYKIAADEYKAIAELSTDENLKLNLAFNKAAKENYQSKIQKEISYTNEIAAIQMKNKMRIVTALAIIFTLIAGASFYIIYLKKMRKLDRERLFLTQSVHDEIAPLVLFTTKSLTKYHKENNMSTPAYNDLNEQILNVSNMVRQVSHEINENKRYSTNNLLSYIKKLENAIIKLSEKQIYFNHEIPDMPISFSQFYRIRLMISEMVSNSIKHADYNMISLKLTYEDRKIMIYYSDDGAGFDPKKMDDSGIGIKNLGYHAEVLRGQVHLHNQFPAGYYYKISIPLI